MSRRAVDDGGDRARSTSRSATTRTPRRRLARVDTLRERLRDLPTGATALVGAAAPCSTTSTTRQRATCRVIVPVALLVIAIILGILLQAIVAPLVLIATVVVSFFGTLGLSILFFIEVGETGVDASLPTFAFIFLVALGIDYTIFLMSRVREEARRHGTREGVLRALAATGPVITSAGIILAGTFSVLMTLPVTFVFNIGFMVAVGILLDTFVVRTIMVPAAVELRRPRPRRRGRAWRPSDARALGGQRGAAARRVRRGGGARGARRLGPGGLRLARDQRHRARAARTLGLDAGVSTPMSAGAPTAARSGRSRRLLERPCAQLLVRRVRVAALRPQRVDQRRGPSALVTARSQVRTPAAPAG